MADKKEISQKQVESSTRMKILLDKISDAIKEANDEIDGDFSVVEVVYVLTNNIKSYTTHGLKAEWKK